MNLQQNILGIHFGNPTVLASGIWGITASGWRRATEGGAGAITTKSLWLREHRGHPNPTIISTPYWSLNAVGVPDAGPEKAREEIGTFLEWRETIPKEKRPPLIANIIAETVENFGATAEKIAALTPDAIEVNISCPNVEDEFGKPFACSLPDAIAVTKIVKGNVGTIPIFIKLSPNVENIGMIARGVSEAGADGLTVINTVGPGMAIDLKTRMPILANKVGGLSGRAIKPIAVRCIADCYSATGGTVPIIGTGGVVTGEDAIELMMAGASLIGIGTALWERGETIFKLICEEIRLWCDANGVKSLTEIIGGAHPLGKGYLKHSSATT
ncbi:MAG: dihydroorotate dehydrogenase [Patescibacteria group bacterium]